MKSSRSFVVAGPCARRGHGLRPPAQARALTVAERVAGRRGAAPGSMLGVWTSGALPPAACPPGLPTTGTGCSKFEWFVTSQTANAIAGDFSAICLGSISVTGTARGERNGSAVQVTVNGSAILPGIGHCTFSLSSTGTIEGNDALRLPYSGTTCLGPVSGVETLAPAATGRAAAARAAAARPAPSPRRRRPRRPPPPAPSGPGDGSECSYLANDKEGWSVRP